MKGHPIFRMFWISANLLLLACFVFLIYSVGWECSTERYLHGFSDAVVPKMAPPEEKIQAILNWMNSGPTRRSGPVTTLLADRDPEETLNYRSLLQVCGSATNAFINLALRSGLKARRLLLVGPRGAAKHVDAQVWIDGRWVVVDPAFRAILCDSSGAMLTRQQLADPQTLATATKGLANYLPGYTFESTSHVHLDRFEFFGPVAGKVLDAIAPGWEGSLLLTLVLERESFASLVLAGFLCVFLLMARLFLSWFASARLGIRRVHFTERLREGGLAFLKQMS
jgi:hypothetical protein